MTKAETDAEREIRNPGTGNRTAGGRQSEQLGLVVMAKPHYKTKLDEADAELVFDPWPKFERFIYILSPSPATRTDQPPARRSKVVVRNRRRLERWYTLFKGRGAEHR